MDHASGPPRRLAHYELLDEIGRGGMGVVYRARDTRLDRLAAVKVLPPAFAGDADRRARLRREARAAARLSHPSIATVYEMGEAADADQELAGRAREVVYIAMEYVEGEDLSQCLESRRLSLQETLDFAVQIADGLASAHQAGVIHRDLKPGNVRITPDGRVKILDFGLGKILHGGGGGGGGAGAEAPPTSLTLAGGILGSVRYMSPEQLEGSEVDERSDLFSLGVVLYQMLTGRPPFTGRRLVDYATELVTRPPESPSRSNPQISPELERVVERLLAIDLAERYASAATVSSDLKAIVRSRMANTPPTTELPPRPVPSSKKTSSFKEMLSSVRKRWRVPALACGVLLALVGGMTLLERGRSAPPPVRNLAVLPFENRTDDPGLDAFYAGIGEALVRKLSGIRGLNVVDDLDVRHYRESSKTSEEIARELDVGTLVRGYVQGTGERIRIVVAVMNAQPAVSIWTGEIEGSPSQLLSLQARLAEETAAHMPVTLSEPERQRLRKNPTRSQQAYAAYADAEAALAQVDQPATAERAVELFGRALELDPDFSWAYAGLAQALLRRYADTRAPELLDRAEAAAARAVALSPDLPEPRIARAQVRQSRGRLVDAVEDLHTALEKNPDLDAAHSLLAVCYWDKGELALAERSYRKAITIRPLAWRHWNQLGAFFLETGRYEESREAFEKAAGLAPQEVIWPLENLGTLALNQGDFATALAAYDRIPPVERTPSLLDSMGTLSFMLGRLAESEMRFRRAAELQPAEPLHWLNLGDAQLRQGEPKAALESYRAALSKAAAQLQINPHEDRLRVLWPMLLAKAGECARAGAAAEELHRETAGRSEVLVLLAKAFAVCHERERTLGVLEEALATGITPQRLQGEFELEWLGDDPKLRAWLAAATPGS